MGSIVQDAVNILEPARPIVVGVLALQGAFIEHINLLRRAGARISPRRQWEFIEVRKPTELERCDALVIPGGESTTMALVAERSGLMQPLREFVKIQRKPVWGTCAGLILLAESANRTKKNGQQLIGGLDVRVNRNHFGRQTESFEAALDLPFLSPGTREETFRGVFIRAPVVEALLPDGHNVTDVQSESEKTVLAPPAETLAKHGGPLRDIGQVQVLARLPGRAASTGVVAKEDAGDVIAVQQANCFGTSFHPELTGDERMHLWWLDQVCSQLDR